MTDGNERLTTSVTTRVSRTHEWKYVMVRRLALIIEESLYRDL